MTSFDIQLCATLIEKVAFKVFQSLSEDAPLVLVPSRLYTERPEEVI